MPVPQMGRSPDLGSVRSWQGVEQPGRTREPARGVLLRREQVPTAEQTAALPSARGKSN